MAVGTSFVTSSNRDLLKKAKGVHAKSKKEKGRKRSRKPKR